MNDQNPNLWQEIAAALKNRQPVVAVTVVRSSGSVPRRAGAKMLVYTDGAIRGSVGGGLFEALVVKDALQALAGAMCVTKTYSFNPEGSGPQAFGAVCGGRAEIFLETIMPPDRLLIVGGGHCGRALAKMASLLDFSIIIADDREEFARQELFPFSGVESVLHLPPDYAGLPAPDDNTYVALVSKGFVTDEAALRRVLASRASYIGMIGSCRKRDIVYERLRADGVSEAVLGRVHAPIGLEIGAETPEEIAISILAQIVAVRAKRRAAGAATDAGSASADRIYAPASTTDAGNSPSPHDIHAPAASSQDIRDVAGSAIDTPARDGLRALQSTVRPQADTDERGTENHASE